MIVPYTFLHGGSMNELTLLNYRVWNIYLLLLVSLLLLGCSYAGKPTFKTCQDVCDGLVGYYPFFGNANDLSGNGNDGNVSGATLTNDRDENVDSAYLFNGKDSLINFPSLIIKQSTTIVVIFKANSYPMELEWDYPFFAIVWDRDPSDPSIGIKYGGDKQGQGNIEFAWESDTNKSANYHTKHRENRYFHLAGVYDKKKGISEIYLNGLKKAASKLTAGQRIKFDGIKIGIRDVNNLMVPAAFNGVIDEVRVYDRALSSEEIYKIFEK